MQGSWKSRAAAAGATKVAASGARSQLARAFESSARRPQPLVELKRPDGAELEVVAGQPAAAVPCGCPQGTAIEVRNLFFNTPVRRKFLRSVQTEDYMTADWSHLPYDLLATISTRIINRVPGVNRVVYDISSKPPATIEWE